MCSQLQVLTILDSTAMSWPGIQQAVDDLQFLVDMSATTNGRLESDYKAMQDTVKDCQQEVATLRETLGMQNDKKEELEREVAQLNKEVKQVGMKAEPAFHAQGLGALCGGRGLAWGQGRIWASANARCWGAVQGALHH